MTRIKDIKNNKTYYITYDANKCGQPIKMWLKGKEQNLLWEDKNLIQIGEHIKYSYNTEGIRTKKETEEGTTEYSLIGSKIMKMEKVTSSGKITMYFTYDQRDELQSVTESNKEYYYIKDITGNIIKIKDEEGNSIVEYKYDAYGKVEKTIIENNNVSKYNPFIYKGYYYDEETELYYCNTRYYSPEIGRWISIDDVGYLDPESINGLNLYCYCMNDSMNYKQRPISSGGSVISSSISVGGSSVTVGGSSGGGNLGGVGNPTAPWWASTAVGAIPDFILGMRYLAASGMHSKFAYVTNTRYMHPIMGGTWRWFSKSTSSFGTVAQGTFKQILTGDARAGFGAIAKSVAGAVGLNALVNFEFNLYENNWQVDSTMLVDTAIDTAIGVGSYFLAAGAMSLATAGLLAVGVALPGIIVVAGVVILSIGFEHVIRAISGYWD